MNQFKRKITKKILFLGALLCFAFSFGQQENTDKITINATLHPEEKIISVRQKIDFVNNSSQTIHFLWLHAAINAYANSNTKLGKRKLEDRNKNLYFADYTQRGRLNDFLVFEGDAAPQYFLKENEFYQISLNKALKPGGRITLDLFYNLKIPIDDISSYGFTNENDFLLKYFFIQPLNVFEENPNLKHFLDIEYNPYRQTYYDIKFHYPKEYHLSGNLKVEGNTMKGSCSDSPTILLSKFEPASCLLNIEGQKVEVTLGYEFNTIEKDLYSLGLIRELIFLKNKLGKIPDKIFISVKTRRMMSFFGVDDLDVFGLTELKVFPEDQRIDLKLFQQVAYEVLNQKLKVDKEKDHWILNGLITYYQMEYIKQFYGNTKLVGILADKTKVLGLKPLKWFFISTLPLSDRYKLAYSYITTQNYDQSLNENYLNLSNINQIIISEFKSGLGFNYLSEYMGKPEFENKIRSLIAENENKIITLNTLKEKLETNTTKDFNWYFTHFINQHDRVNFGLKKFKERKDSLEIKIKNYTKLPVPILISATKKDSLVTEKWYFSDKKNNRFNFPKGDYDKLILNRDFLIPEVKETDNVTNTHGFFKNAKKVQLKFYSDAENPDYNQIFYDPKIKWNNYDKFMLGFRFYNSSPFSTKKISYTFSPSYSTGTNDLTGNGAISYNKDFTQGVFRRITASVTGSYFHYDTNLSYKQVGGALNFNFSKNSRSDVTQTLGISFNSVTKEKNPLDLTLTDDYTQYNLLNFSYIYSDPRLINEWNMRFNFQHSNLFNKLEAETLYRFEYARDRKLLIRLFGGIFLSNDSNTDYFNYGIDHITDYAFNYINFLGRSATSGILYQQYLMAEGGFKSMLDKSASSWIVSLNTEMHLWRPFNIYADVGLFKSKYKSTEFIYDSGVKLQVIPEFLEIYFPIQSTLGFEPALDNYFSNIRFVFNLLNIPQIISHIRRGWF